MNVAVQVNPLGELDDVQDVAKVSPVSLVKRPEQVNVWEGNVQEDNQTLSSLVPLNVPEQVNTLEGDAVVVQVDVNMVLPDVLPILEQVKALKGDPNDGQENIEVIPYFKSQFALTVKEQSATMTTTKVTKRP